MRNLLDRDLVLEALHDIVSLYLSYFFSGVLLNKIRNVHVATAHSDQYLVAFLNSDVHAPLPELVDSLRLSQE